MTEDKAIRWLLPNVDADKMKTLALLLGDPNPIHLSKADALAVGLPDGPVNQGPATIAMLFNLFESERPRERVTRVSVRLHGNVIADQRVDVSASVSNDPDVAAGTKRYDVVVTAENVAVITGTVDTTPRSGDEG